MSPRRLVTSLLALVCTTACGGDDAPAPSGEVAPPWDTYCVATFTEDYDIMGFDRLTLRINAGETYLVRRLEIGDRVDPEVVFLGERGVYGLDLALEGKPLPFTSNCASGMTQSYAGAFADVTLYKDADATEVACTLAAGTVWPSAGGGYALTGDLTFDPNTPLIYRVNFDGLAGVCGGATEAFMKAYSERVGEKDARTYALSVFLGPAAVP